jgi:hypothetical protein
VARCPCYIAGPLLGLLIVALRAAVNRPLGSDVPAKPAEMEQILAFNRGSVETKAPA